MRHASRSAHLLLWLLLALLPLRGLAQGVMALGPLGASPTAVMQAPCHDMGGHHDTESPAPAQHAGAPCQLCDLCHAGIAAWTGHVPTGADLPDTRPTPQAQPAPARRDADSLFRPPRP